MGVRGGYLRSGSEIETPHENVFENAQEVNIERENCVVRRVKCGHRGPMQYDRNPCDYQVQSLQSPSIYHHIHHNGKRQKPKLRPLKVLDIISCVSMNTILHFIMFHQLKQNENLNTFTANIQNIYIKRTLFTK